METNSGNIKIGYILKNGDEVLGKQYRKWPKYSVNRFVTNWHPNVYSSHAQIKALMTRCETRLKEYTEKRYPKAFREKYEEHVGKMNASEVVAVYYIPGTETVSIKDLRNNVVQAVR